MLLRLAIALTALGLLLGGFVAVGDASSPVLEVPFGFSQAGEPLKHPGDVIETTMVGKGVIRLGQTLNFEDASGTIAYHESHLLNEDVDLRLTVDYASGDIATRGVRLHVTITDSNSSGCPTGTTGEIVISAVNGEATIRFEVCGRNFGYAAKIAKNSRVNVSYENPKRCLTELPTCPEAPGPPTTTAPGSTTTAAKTITTVTLVAGSASCTEYLVAEDGFNAGDEHCNGGAYDVSGSWFLKVSKSATVSLTASVNAPLPAGAGLQINGSPPLCKTTSGETCTASVGPYPALTTPQNVDVSVGYTTAAGGAGPALALVFSP